VQLHRTAIEWYACGAYVAQLAKGEDEYGWLLCGSGVEDVNDSASAGAQLAGLAVEVRHLAQAIERVAADVKELRTDLDEVRAIVQNGKGAWSAMLVVGAIATTLAGAVAWGLEHLLGKGGAI
jgi:hypothetical protein